MSLLAALALLMARPYLRGTEIRNWPQETLLEAGTTYLWNMASVLVLLLRLRVGL